MTNDAIATTTNLAQNHIEIPLSPKKEHENKKPSKINETTVKRQENKAEIILLQVKTLSSNHKLEFCMIEFVL